MKTIEQLSRAVTNLSEALSHQDQHQPEQETTIPLRLDLLAEDERPRLQAFLTRISDIMGGIVNLPLLSDQDLYELELWTRLEIALRDEETDQAANLRAQLARCNL